MITDHGLVFIALLGSHDGDGQFCLMATGWDTTKSVVRQTSLPDDGVCQYSDGQLCSNINLYLPRV